MTNKGNISRTIIAIVCFFLINTSYAELPVRYTGTAEDFTGLWTDNNGNYYSLQVENGMVLFIDLSRSFPRAEELTKIGVEPKVEYMVYYGEVSYVERNFGLNGELSIPVLLNLRVLFPQIDSTIKDHDLRLNAIGSSTPPFNKIAITNYPPLYADISPVARSLYKIY